MKIPFAPNHDKIELLESGDVAVTIDGTQLFQIVLGRSGDKLLQTIAEKIFTDANILTQFEDLTFDGFSPEMPSEFLATLIFTPYKSPFGADNARVNLLC